MSKIKDEKKAHRKETTQEICNAEIVQAISQSFADATGLKLVLKIAKYSAVGVFMGASDAVPGYSGGTTLSLVGYFTKLVLLAKSIFIPEKGITRLRAFLLMLPFGAGWLLGIFGIAKLTHLMINSRMPLELMFFFSTFVLTTVPLFIIRERPGIINMKKKRLQRTKLWYLVILGFAFILGITLTARLALGGANFEKVNIHHYNLSHLEWMKLMGVSFLAGCITLIPGGSGALVQLLSKEYDKIHWIMLTHVKENLLGLTIFSISTFLGMLVMVFIMAWGLKKHQKILASLSFGMLLAAIPSILIIPAPKTWDNLKDTIHIIGVVASSVTGAASGMLTIYLTKRHMARQSA